MVLNDTVVSNTTTRATKVVTLSREIRRCETLGGSANGTVELTKIESYRMGAERPSGRVCVTPPRAALRGGGSRWTWRQARATIPTCVERCRRPLGRCRAASGLRVRRAGAARRSRSGRVLTRRPAGSQIVAVRLTNAVGLLKHQCGCFGASSTGLHFPVPRGGPAGARWTAMFAAMGCVYQRSPAAGQHDVETGLHLVLCPRPCRISLPPNRRRQDGWDVHHIRLSVTPRRAIPVISV